MAVRNLAAVAVPMAGVRLFGAVGVGWGCTVLGIGALGGGMVWGVVGRVWLGKGRGGERGDREGERTGG